MPEGDKYRRDKEEFLDKSENLNYNYNGEFMQPVADFIMDRKAIFTCKGLVISGKKLE